MFLMYHMAGVARPGGVFTGPSVAITQSLRDRMNGREKSQEAFSYPSGNRVIIEYRPCVSSKIERKFSQTSLPFTVYFVFLACVRRVLLLPLPLCPGVFFIVPSFSNLTLEPS